MTSAMRSQSQLLRTAKRLQLPRSVAEPLHRRRAIQISAAPATVAPRAREDAFVAIGESARDGADARFEVLGSPYSMLMVTLSASQKLYTRRGTLIAVAGEPENAQSTLSLLTPLTRAPFGVPFIYQRISATTPITALISTKSPTTTFSVLHLDGTTDWMVSQRNALLAWTGHTLHLSSQIQRKLALAHWGSTLLTGRGLAALTAPGQTYQLTLGEGEEFVAHPGSVVAYSVTKDPPQPFRFQSTSLRLSIPSLTSWIPETEWMKIFRKSEVYRRLSQLFFYLRTVMRRTIWGDRLFLQFRGPATILMSSRGVRILDTLTNEQVNEVADAPAGVLAKAVELSTKTARNQDEQVQESQVKAEKPREEGSQGTVEQAPTVFHVASVAKDGHVKFEDTKDLKKFM